MTVTFILNKFPTIAGNWTIEPSPYPVEEFKKNFGYEAIEYSLEELLLRPDLRRCEYRVLVVTPTGDWLMTPRNTSVDNPYTAINQLEGAVHRLQSEVDWMNKEFEKRSIFIEKPKVHHQRTRGGTWGGGHMD